MAISGIIFGAESEYLVAAAAWNATLAFDASKFIVAYQDGSDSNHGTAKIGTISGTTINYGPESEFLNNGNASYISLAPLGESGFVVIYRDGADGNHATAKFGTVSGTTITFGAETEFLGSTSTFMSVAALSGISSGFVVSYKGPTNGYGEAKIGTVSGTTITFYPETIFYSGGQTYDIAVAAIGPTKFVTTHRAGLAHAGTVSGTTITFGDGLSFDSSPVYITRISALSEDKFVVVSRNPGFDGNSRIGTVSGTDITFGAKVEFATTCDYPALATISESQFIVFYQYGNPRIGSVSGTTVEYGPEIEFLGGTTSYNSIITTSESGSVFVYRDTSDSNHGTSNFGTLLSETITSGTTSGNITLFTQGSLSVSGNTGKLYWTDRDTNDIRRCNLDGSDVEVLVAGLSTPMGITIDSLNGKIYWVDDGTNKIQRANLDGSDVEDLITAGLITPTSIDVDPQNKKIYWSDRGTFKIQRANLDGSNIEDLVTTGLSFPHGVALDVLNEKIYWTDNGTDKIQRANFDGSDVEDLITTGLDLPNGLKLDIDNGKMYWTDYGTDKIQRANLDGSSIEDLVTTGLDIPHGIVLDLLSGKMYWVDNGTDKIQRANLDGSDVEDVLTTGLVFPDGIDIDYGIDSMVRLYIKVVEPIVDSSDLFINGLDNIAASGNLFIDGIFFIPASGDLFINGIGTETASVNMYIVNFENTSGNTDLFIHGVITIPTPSTIGQTLDWFIRTADYNPQVIGTFASTASSATIQVWDVTDGQNTLVSITSSGCYAIGNTGRWGWSTSYLPAIQGNAKHYFYLMTTNEGATFDGQFLMDVPEGAKWIYPDNRDDYIL